MLVTKNLDTLLPTCCSPRDVLFHFLFLHMPLDHVIECWALYFSWESQQALQSCGCVCVV